MNSRESGPTHQNQTNKSLPLVRSLSDEWIVLRFLKRWTADDIRLAIERDVDLEELILGHRAEASPISAMASRYDPEPWSVDDILFWFSVRRPDLHVAFVEDKKGAEWIRKHWKRRMGIKSALTT